MLGLIVVSVMVAAFAPVITKKVTNTSVALSQQDVVAGKVIKSLIYNYSPALNGVDGCSIQPNVGNSKILKCPFEVPEGVNKVNFVLVAGGGGGAGGGNTSTTTTPVNLPSGSNRYKEITITKFIKNVKIPIMASGGGGGGGGYYYYKYTAPQTIHPTSQADCNKVAVNSTYKNGLCITKNLAISDIGAENNIKELSSNKYDHKAQGTTKICWKGNTGYEDWYDSCPNNNCTEYYWYAKKAKPYPVCTYDAAKEMCRLYNQGTASFGKWRLPKSEAEVNKNLLWMGNQGKNGENDGPMSQRCYYGPIADFKANSSGYSTVSSTKAVCDSWGDAVLADNYKSTVTEKYDYYYNACMPNFVWYDSVDDTLMYTEGYVHSKDVICKNSSDTYWQRNAGRTEFKTYDKAMSALSVQCVLDDIGSSAEVHEYNHSSGGGGASGQYLANITIPQDKITAAIGGKIIIQAGRGGFGGTASSSSGVTASGGEGGGDSYVKVQNSAGTVIWQVILPGGAGGKKGASSSAGQGAVAGTTYTITSGTPSHTRGNSGANGINQAFSGSAPGGYGGAAINGYGAGGNGGAASDNSASAGSNGSSGYVSLTYDTVYLGAPGGGGAGGSIARFENISVTEGTRYWVNVGGGGAAGVNTNGGDGGQSRFGDYYVNGGYGGKRGTNQTAAANPVAGIGGNPVGAGTSTGAVFYKDGTAGGAGSINSTTLYGTGGVGGNSGLNNYYLTALSKSYSELSVGCGGYFVNATLTCANSSNKNARYTGDEFANPGKIHRAGSTKYGSAGSGGGGGGIDPNSSTPGTASKGQDGYVYIWWEDYAD